MFNSKKDIFIVANIVFGAVFFYVALNHIDVVINAFSTVSGWFTPVIAGLGTAFFLNVFVRFIEEKLLKKFKGKKWLRGTSITLSLLFILAVLILLAFIILPQIKRTAFSLAESLPRYIDKTIAKLEKIELPADIDIDDILKTEHLDDLTKKLTSTSVDIMGNALSATTLMAGKFFTALIGLVIAIYILAYKETLGKYAKRTVRAFLSEDKAKSVLYIAELSYNTFYNFITGQLTEAVILGTLCYIGMLIFRFPYAAAISMLVGVTALIPIVGAFIGIAVGAFLIVIENPLQALFFVIYIVILQQIEGNLIYPKVVGKSVGLPAILVIIAVLVGGRIGGLVAVLVSVPVCSIVYSIFKAKLEERERKNRQANNT